jgi:DNA repair exonuclease SbcCD ATPase subunit
MRIESLTVSNFRGITRQQTFPLDADIVVIWGLNGTGKTSLLDAIQWLFVGEVPRLKELALKPTEDYVSSQYATGLPYVSARLRGDVQEHAISRVGHGKDTRLTVSDESDGSVHEGEEARMRLESLLGRDFYDPSSFFLRTHVLQQDAMTELLRGDSKERYQFLAELTGLEELQRLDSQLQSELKALRKGLRTSTEDVERMRTSVQTAEREFEGSQRLISRDAELRTQQVRAATERLANALAVSLADAPREVLNAAFQIRSTLDTFAPYVANLEETVRDLNLEINEVRQQVADAARALAAAEERVEDLHDELIGLAGRLDQARSDLDDRRQLASLALSHLDGDCPVCGQQHDLKLTRSRLQKMLSDESLSRLQERQIELSSRLSREQGSRQQISFEHGELHAALSRAEARLASIHRTQEQFEGVSHLPLFESVSTFAEQSQSLERLITRLERSLELAESDRRETSRATSIQRDVGARRDRLKEAEVELAELQHREKRASEACRWVGQTITEITGEIIDRTTPLANNLYRRFDVHPTFRRFTFHPDRRWEKGHLRPWLFDDEMEHDAAATHVLSAAQLNALAICLFLALNMEDQSSFATVLMDDPVQSMDDLTILSLADVLRAIRDRRQVILTTHEIVLAQVLLRKLRPLSEGQENLFLKLSRWTRSGPRLDVERRAWDPQLPRLELVAPDEGWSETLT